MNSKTTDDVLNLVFQNAKIDASKIMQTIQEKSYPETRKLLRFYRSDIPKTPRYMYDGDAVWFYNYDEKINSHRNDKRKKCIAERGDILVSFWAPFTFFLKLNNERLLSKNDANIEMLTKHIDNRNDGAEAICRIMSYLAINYMTRGNLLRLPNTINKNNRRNMNPDKFACSEDKIDQFLWHCFEGGKLFEYFSSNENVEKWVLSERLECMFFQGFFEKPIEEILSGKVTIANIQISRETLQSLVDNSDVANYKYRDEAFQWETYFERVNKVIAYRNTVRIKSRTAFDWEQ